MDIKPLHRHLAVTLDSYNRLSFGINDLTVNLDNRSIVSDVGNVYQVPSASEPDKFFTGETHFQADGLEVLVLEGELFLALSSCSLTAAWLAQLRERRSTEREVTGSIPGRANTQGLYISEKKVLSL